MARRSRGVRSSRHERRQHRREKRYSDGRCHDSREGEFPCVMRNPAPNRITGSQNIFWLREGKPENRVGLNRRQRRQQRLRRLASKRDPPGIHPSGVRGFLRNPEFGDEFSRKRTQRTQNKVVQQGCRLQRYALLGEGGNPRNLLFLRSLRSFASSISPFRVTHCFSVSSVPSC
jgi:hypothetical protein